VVQRFEHNDQIEGAMVGEGSGIANIELDGDLLRGRVRSGIGDGGLVRIEADHLGPRKGARNGDGRPAGTAADVATRSGDDTSLAWMSAAAGIQHSTRSVANAGRLMPAWPLRNALPYFGYATPPPLRYAASSSSRAPPIPATMGQRREVGGVVFGDEHVDMLGRQAVAPFVSGRQGIGDNDEPRDRLLLQPLARLPRRNSGVASEFGRVRRVA
jgi:hypothetical protein